MDVIILRPATVCGFSPRMRLDLTVNMLTFQALKTKNYCFCGKQKRPNIHIDDFNRRIYFLHRKKYKSNIFNIGFENLSILKISNIISRYIKAKIVIKKNYSDPRSYNLEFFKIVKNRFKLKKKVIDAIKELKYLYDLKILKDKT